MQYLQYPHSKQTCAVSSGVFYCWGGGGKFLARAGAHSSRRMPPRGLGPLDPAFTDRRRASLSGHPPPVIHWAATNCMPPGAASHFLDGPAAAAGRPPKQRRCLLRHRPCSSDTTNPRPARPRARPLPLSLPSQPRPGAVDIRHVRAGHGFPEGVCDTTFAWYFRLGGSSGSVDLRAGTPALPGARTGVLKPPLVFKPKPSLPVDPAAVAGRASPTPLFPTSTSHLGTGAVTLRLTHSPALSCCLT
jgi:hypothetical protein